MIFKDFDTLLSDGGGAYQQGEHFYCSAVKTMETKERTRTDTGEWGGSAAAPHLQHFCHPRLPEYSARPGLVFLWRGHRNRSANSGGSALQLFTPKGRLKKYKLRKIESIHGNPTRRGSSGPSSCWFPTKLQNGRKSSEDQLTWELGSSQTGSKQNLLSYLRILSWRVNGISGHFWYSPSKVAGQ